MPTATVPVLRSEFLFGATKVRIFEHDHQLWIPRIDVAEAVGYSDPKRAAGLLIDRNRDDFLGCQGVIKLITPGGAQDTLCLNERGVYTFAFLAKTPMATQFRRRVAELLENIRRGNLRLVDPVRALELEIEKIKAQTEARRLEIEQARISLLNSFLGSAVGVVSPSMLVNIMQTMLGLRTNQERTYSTDELAEHLSLKLNQNITRQMIGRVVNDPKRCPDPRLRPAVGQETELAGWVHTLGYGGRKCTVPFYKEAAVPIWEDYFTRNPVKSRKRPLPSVNEPIQLELELEPTSTVVIRARNVV